MGGKNSKEGAAPGAPPQEAEAPNPAPAKAPSVRRQLSKKESKKEAKATAKLFGGKKLSVLIIGLDNSGKTTIIESLKPEKLRNAEVVPTVGFQVEEFSTSGITLTCVDMSGAGKYRALWETYYRDCEAVVFVVDSADEIRLAVVGNELQQLIEHQDIRPDLPVLVFANKKDLPKSMKPVTIAQRLKLTDLLRSHPWQIMHTNALTGEGLDEGIHWLAEACSARRK
ncbi:unnamed protein product [Pedinophyceae sp. YPF-701]|nr:unnamed protein product [Pedinophyceae sp. YPF-701]